MMIQGSTEDYTESEVLKGIGGSITLFFLLMFIVPQYRLITIVVNEKASRNREGMKMMGLRDTPYWLSWFVHYL